MDFTNVKRLVIPEGEVVKIERSGVTLWRKSTGVDWYAVRAAVRNGTAPTLYPVGTTFTVHDSDENLDVPWRVVAYDNIMPADSGLTHSMLLEMAELWSSSNGVRKELPYDSQEAFYYAENGTEAGTYHFTVKGQTWVPTEENVDYQFTPANAVPRGSQWMLTSSYSEKLEGKNISAYASPTATTVTQTAVLTAGSGGTSLGSTDGNGMNDLPRCFLGSNNYYQSGLRQLLNSDAASFVFAPSNKYDRPIYSTSYKGFLHGLPEDFVAVMAPAELPCRTNSKYEVDSFDGTTFVKNQVYSITTDKVFVLSRPEIYGTWDSTAYKDGELCAYYSGTTDSFKIKRDHAGTAYRAWLRSPSAYSSHINARVEASGALGAEYASRPAGVAAACIIA